MFALASAQRSEALMFSAAAISSIGLAALPIEVVLGDRLSEFSRGQHILVAVLVIQGLHTVEQVVQLVQSYRLDRPAARSLGLVSQLNVEWVRFGWNWFAWTLVIAAWRCAREANGCQYWCSGFCAHH